MSNLIWRIKQYLLELRYGKHSSAIDSEPVHSWFELTYAQYLTLPRSLMQEMPIKWQREFVKLLEEFDETYDWRPEKGRYWVNLKDGNGRFVEDKLRNYRHPDMDYINGIKNKLDFRPWSISEHFKVKNKSK